MNDKTKWNSPVVVIATCLLINHAALAWPTSPFFLEDDVQDSVTQNVQKRQVYSPPPVPIVPQPYIVPAQQYMAPPALLPAQPYLQVPSPASPPPQQYMPVPPPAVLPAQQYVVPSSPPSPPQQLYVVPPAILPPQQYIAPSPAQQQYIVPPATVPTQQQYVAPSSGSLPQQYIIPAAPPQQQLYVQPVPAVIVPTTNTPSTQQQQALTIATNSFQAPVYGVDGSSSPNGDPFQAYVPNTYYTPLPETSDVLPSDVLPSDAPNQEPGYLFYPASQGTTYLPKAAVLTVDRHQGYLVGPPSEPTDTLVYVVETAVPCPVATDSVEYVVGNGFVAPMASDYYVPVVDLIPIEDQSAYGSLVDNSVPPQPAPAVAVAASTAPITVFGEGATINVFPLNGGVVKNAPFNLPQSSYYLPAASKYNRVAAHYGKRHRRAHAQEDNEFEEYQSSS